jgi:hypothetical protein
MKLSACALMAAVCFAINCFADGTNGVSGGNQEKKIVVEDGPLKELATIVLNTGTKMNLDTKGTLRPGNVSYTSTFPKNAALQFGLVSSNNEPFEVYGLNDLLPDPVYHHPRTITMIRVSQQRGRTDIIFATIGSDIGHITIFDLFLTSPSGEVKEAYQYWTDSGVNLIADGNYHNTFNAIGTQETFRNETNFWLEKLGASKMKPAEPKK